ncbi:MAG: bL17 family ribosomal protein [Patescibacteria group bacterium]|nr:bL17 family ribosomal protein [Patescibacteria group bacterium]
MKHQIKKIKFRGGKDANKMLMRKLCVNFLSEGVLTTTEAKAKAVKSVLDKIIARAAKESESSRRFIQQQVGRRKLVDALITKVGPKVKEIQGGYVSLKRAHIRINDGSQMVTVRWAHEIESLMREEPEAPAKKKSKSKPQQITKTSEKQADENLKGKKDAEKLKKSTVKTEVKS